MYIGITDCDKGVSSINGNLANWIDSGETTKVYNTSIRQEKSFNGNIVLFSENPFQYMKRFPKNECCGVVQADKIDLNERTSMVHNGMIDNMVEWNFNGSTVKICRKCGYIDRNFSTVIRQEQKQEPEQEPEQEPNSNEISELESLYKL